MRPYLVAGLDIGSTKTAAVILEVTGDTPARSVLRVLGVGQTRTGGMRREVVTDIEETTDSVRKAMKEAELMAGVSVDRVFAGIAGEHIDASSSTGVVAVGRDEIGPDDVERVHQVARAVVVPGDRELLHVIPQEYIADHQSGIHDPVGMVGTRLEAEVYIITSAARPAQNLRKAVARAGYRVDTLVYEPLATALAVLTPDERDIGVALIDLGGGTTEVAIFRDDKMHRLPMIPWGGAAITSDLVKGLSLPFAEAERAKQQYGVAFAQLVDPRELVELAGPGPQAKREIARELIAHIIEQRLDEILGLVAQGIEDAGEADKLGAGVVLTGGGAMLAGTIDVAQHVFASPVRIGTPGEDLAGLADSIRRPKFATATGLAIYGANQALDSGATGASRGERAVGRMVAWLKEFF